MKRRTFVVASLLLSGLAPCAIAQQAVYLVRHAERLDFNDNNSPLSEAGHARARLLGRMLKDAGLSAIYVTEFRRTRDTGAPLAAALKIEPTAIPLPPSAAPMKPQGEARALEQVRATLKHVRANHARKVVLIVGHGDTLPLFLRELGHPEKVEIAREEWDNLFVVIPKRGAAPTVLRLRY